MYFSSTQTIKLDNGPKNLKHSNKSELASTHVFLPSPDNERIMKTRNGDHTGIVSQLCIEIALFC